MCPIYQSRWEDGPQRRSEEGTEDEEQWDEKKSRGLGKAVR